MKYLRKLQILVLVGALILLTAVVVAPAAAQNDDTPRTITVTGIGSADGTPDVAFIQLGVEVVDRDLAVAFTETNDTMDSVLAAILALGVDEADTQTQGLNIFPEERFGPSGPIMLEGEDGPTPDRVFRVRNTLSITVRDVELVADVINAAVSAGANNVFGLNFGIDDPAGLEAEARTAAVDDARERAQQLADAFGVMVGAPLRINEGFGDVGIPLDARFAFGLGGGGGGPVINEGQFSVAVQLNVTFELIDAA